MQPGQGPQRQPGRGPRQRPPGQPGEDRGCACTLFAVVDANGSLGRNFRAFSSQRFSTGQYEVVFNRDVSGCAYVATIGNPGNDTIPLPGEIAVAGRLGDTDAVFIATYNSDGNLADHGFHLAVHCPDN